MSEAARANLREQLPSHLEFGGQSAINVCEAAQDVIIRGVVPHHQDEFDIPEANSLLLEDGFWCVGKI